MKCAFSVNDSEYFLDLLLRMDAGRRTSLAELRVLGGRRGLDRRVMPDFIPSSIEISLCGAFGAGGEGVEAWVNGRHVFRSPSADPRDRLCNGRAVSALTDCRRFER